MTMRARRRVAALLGCLAIALAQAGCGGGQEPGAASFTCGHMRDTVGAFRDQARLIVDREGFKTSALSIESAVLGVELLVRNACRAAGEGYQPYAAVARAAPVD
jgi:hypothetical protein